MQIKKRGSIYYLYYYCSEIKRDRKTSLHTEHYKEAIERAKFYLDSVDTELPAVGWTVEKVLQLYSEEHIKPHNINPQATLWKVKPLLRLLGHLRVDELTKPIVTGYRVSRGVSSGTVRSELAILIAALKYAHGENKIESIPAIQLPAANPARSRWLDQSEIEAFLEAGKSMRVHPDRYARAELFFIIALYTGQRSRAVETLTWDRVNFERQQIDFSYRETQTSKRSGLVEMHPELERVLLQVHQSRKNCWVLGSDGAIRKTFDRLKTKAGITDCSPITLRHTCASILVSSGVSTFIVAGILGNTPAMIEKTYGHLNREAQRNALLNLAVK